MGELKAREFKIVPSLYVKGMFVPSDVWEGETNHPQCCFFEMFPSSGDPEETFYGEVFCHMDNSQKSAWICKGDYCKCPLTHIPPYQPEAE